MIYVFEIFAANHICERKKAQRLRNQKPAEAVKRNVEPKERVGDKSLSPQQKNKRKISKQMIPVAVTEDMGKKADVTERN